MFSATTMPVRIIRACDHSEVEELRYRGLRDKSNQQSQARKYFCKDCRELIKTWVEQSVDASPYSLELPALVGSEKQVKWATTLRAAQLKVLLPAMALAAEHGSKIGAAVWQAIYILATQRQAKFWIDNRELGFGRNYVEAEAAYFAMGTVYGAVFSERSVFGRLKASAPYVIEEVKRLCPVGMSAAHA
jgi:hypothetical protein